MGRNVMMETITVDKAIARGHRMVNYPVLILMFGTMGLCFYLGIQKILPFWIFPAGFGLGMALAWLWWSVMITKWRLWAFENVRNVHELRKRAIREKLIWADNNIFEKTEIRSAADREKWKSLQKKFDKEDVFQDDRSVPDETIIFYSRGGNLVEMAVMLVCLAMGIYLLVKTDSYILGSILSVAGAFSGYKEFREATNIEPQIILNAKGIKTISTEFYGWNDIRNEDVMSERSGKHINYYLVYDHPNGSEHLLINDYDTNQNKLITLLILYRGRNRMKSTNGLPV